MATFTYAPDWGASPELEPRVRSVQFGDGYEQRATNGLNPILPTWKLQFTKRTQTEAQAIYSWMVANNAQVTAFDWAAPGEGVAAGELSGTGDGTRVTYSLVALSRPCTVVGTPAIYRTDWQGTQLLYSSARTNRISYSDQPDNAWWTKSGSTITANADAAPDGTGTADKLVESTLNEVHWFRRTYTQTAGVRYCASFHVKAAGRSQVYVRIGSGWVFFDLTTKTAVGATPAGTGTAYGYTDIGGGWLRVWVAYTPTFTGGDYVGLGLVSGATNLYTGDGASGVYVWGIQFEEGSTPTPYIPTAATAVTITDYTLSNGVITLAQTTNPAVGQALGNGTGAQVAFPITVPNASTPTVLAVYVNGVKKTLTTDYTVSGSTITFVVAPALGLLVTVDYTYVGGLGVGNTLTWTGSYTRKHVAKFGVPKPDGFNSWSITADFREVPL